MRVRRPGLALAILAGFLVFLDGAPREAPAVDQDMSIQRLRSFDREYVIPDSMLLAPRRYMGARYRSFTKTWPRNARDVRFRYGTHQNMTEAYVFPRTASPGESLHVALIGMYGPPEFEVDLFSPGHEHIEVPRVRRKLGTQSGVTIVMPGRWPSWYLCVRVSAGPDTLYAPIVRR